MDRGKCEVKYIEDSNTRKAIFSKCQASIFKKADALARQCNADVAVLVNSPAGQPYTYGSPCFNEVVGRFLNPYPRRERSSSSLKQAKILKKQAKLNRLLEELEVEKERVKVLKKKKEEFLEIYNLKDITSLTLEEVLALKEKLEVQRNFINQERMKKEASSMLSSNKKKTIMP